MCHKETVIYRKLCFKSQSKKGIYWHLMYTVMQGLYSEVLPSSFMLRKDNRGELVCW